MPFFHSYAERRVPLGGSGHRLRRLAAACALVATASTGALASDVKTDDPKAAIDYAAPGATFALKLFKNVAPKSHNRLVATAAVRNGLALLSAGASGEAISEIERLAGFQKLPLLHASAARHRSSLVHRTGAEASMSNRIWLQVGFMMKPSFLQTVTGHYREGATYMDLSAPKRQAKVIDAFMAAQLGLIPDDLLDPSSVPPGTPAILTSTGRFKATFSQPFNVAYTGPGDFFAASTPAGPVKASAVDMIRHTFVPAPSGKPAIRYAKRPTHEQLVLPYGDGTVSLVVLLPARNTKSLGSFVKGLTVNDFAPPATGIAANLSVTMPRLELIDDHALSPHFAALGLVAPFGSKTGLSNLGFGDIHVGAFVHRAMLTVDTTGTGTVGATAVVGGEHWKPKGARLAIDRPFVLAVRDDATGDLLYVGQVADPSKLQGVHSKRRRP